VNAERELHVLALNSGSSSLKFGLYQVRSLGTQRLVSGEAESIGTAAAVFHAEGSTGTSLLRERAALPTQQRCRDPHRTAADRPENARTSGHRASYRARGTQAQTPLPHRWFGPRRAQRGRSLCPAAHAIGPVGHPICRGTFPHPAAGRVFRHQLSCTHAGIARVLPIPRALQAEGVERYGFHGLSCESIVRQLQGALPSKLLIAHLGNGASITAVKDGQSIDTSMGLTPTGGIIMGTRSGDLDPGVLVYLARQKKLDAASLRNWSTGVAVC
jgi:acetate kinase